MATGQTGASLLPQSLQVMISSLGHALIMPKQWNTTQEPKRQNNLLC
jgi:hypothetical protein